MYAAGTAKPAAAAGPSGSAPSSSPAAAAGASTASRAQPKAVESGTVASSTAATPQMQTPAASPPVPLAALPDVPALPEVAVPPPLPGDDGAGTEAASDVAPTTTEVQQAMHSMGPPDPHEVAPRGLSQEGGRAAHPLTVFVDVCVALLLPWAQQQTKAEEQKLPWVERYILWLYAVSAEYAIIDNGTALSRARRSGRNGGAATAHRARPVQRSPRWTRRRGDERRR